MEAGVVGARKVLEELRSPGAAEAAIFVEALIDVHAGVDRQGNQGSLTAHVGDVVVVLDAVESFTVGNLILPDEDLVGAFEWGGHDQAAALVVEGGEDERCGCGLFDGLKLRSDGGWADDADDGNRLGDGRDFWA